MKKPFILFLMETYPTVSSNLGCFTHLQLESSFVTGQDAGNCSDCSNCSPDER